MVNLSDLTLNTAVLFGVFFLIYIVAVNFLTYATFALDKRRAIQGRWRISEATLLSLALIGGSVGAKLAQRGFRHKTRKQPFRSLLNLIVVAQIVGLAVLASPLRPTLGALVAGVSVDFKPFAGGTEHPVMPGRFGPGS